MAKQRHNERETERIPLNVYAQKEPGKEAGCLIQIGRRSSLVVNVMIGALMAKKAGESGLALE